MNTKGQIYNSESSMISVNLVLTVGLVSIFMTLSFFNISVFAGIVLCPIIIISILSLLKHPWIILFLIYFVNYFIMGINRYIPIEGISVIMDILYIIAIIIALMHAALYHSIDWKKSIHILTITSLIWASYCTIELINPTASLEGWVLSRGLTFHGLIITVITSLLCTKYRILKLLMFSLSVFTLLAIIKTIIQKYSGFDPTETEWLNAGGSTTHIISSGIRYFSFFTDASNLGANMGGASIFFGIYAFFIKSIRHRVYYFLVAILAIYVMFLSGTRGAMIVPLAGLAMFTIISKQAKSIIGGVSLLLCIYIFFAFTTFGEGNASIRRMRSAFNPTEDASFNVRVNNQQKLGEYMQHRPFGEGLGLSGDGLGVKVSNRFTTSIPTDSWYVKIWVETGVVGLILYLGMIFSAIGRGAWIIMQYVKDPELKGLLSGLLCGIFGMFVSAYGNSFWGQFPTMIIAFIGLSIVLNGKYFESEILNSQQQNLISSK